MNNPVPNRTAWTAAIERISPLLPGADPECFELVAHELDRFHGLGPLERRGPAFSILDALAGWAGRWGGQGSPFERVLQQFWDPVQGWLRTTLVSLFAGEAGVFASLPLPRFVCVQSLGRPLALFLFHRQSWGLAVAVVPPNVRAADSTWALIHAMERSLATGWAGEQIDAYVVGGSTGSDEERLGDIRVALEEARVPASRIQTPWTPRGEDDGPIHVAFDRTEGRVRPFHPGFDPVHYNLRTRQDRERCRVRGLEEAPSLLWPFEDIR